MPFTSKLPGNCRERTQTRRRGHDRPATRCFVVSVAIQAVEASSQDSWGNLEYKRENPTSAAFAVGIRDPADFAGTEHLDHPHLELWPSLDGEWRGRLSVSMRAPPGSTTAGPVVLLLPPDARVLSRMPAAPDQQAETMHIGPIALQAQVFELLIDLSELAMAAVPGTDPRPVVAAVEFAWRPPSLRAGIGRRSFGFVLVRLPGSGLPISPSRRVVKPFALAEETRTAAPGGSPHDLPKRGTNLVLRPGGLKLVESSPEPHGPRASPDWQSEDTMGVHMTLEDPGRRRYVDHSASAMWTAFGGVLGVAASWLFRSPAETPPSRGPRRKLNPWRRPRRNPRPGSLRGRHGDRRRRASPPR